MSVPSPDDFGGQDLVQSLERLRSEHQALLAAHTLAALELMSLRRALSEAVEDLSSNALQIEALADETSRHCKEVGGIGEVEAGTASGSSAPSLDFVAQRVNKISELSSQTFGYLSYLSVRTSIDRISRP